MTITTHEINLSLVQNWLINKIASLTGKNVAELCINTPVADYGLDSMHAVGLSGEIEDWLGVAIEPTIAWDYPTIDSMARHLVKTFSDSIKHHDMNQKVA